MKYLLSLLLIAVAHLTYAQSFIEDHYSSKMDDAEWTSVHISPRMFELTHQIEIDTDDEDLNLLKDAIKQIHALDIIVHEHHSAPATAYHTATDRLEKNFDLLMLAKTPDEVVSCYIQESDGIVSELVVTGHQGKMFFVIDVSGQMDIRQLSQIMNRLSDSGIKQLSAIVEEDIQTLEVYPNPAKVGEELTIKGLKDRPDATVTITDLSGKVVQRLDARQSRSIRTDNLRAGTYVITVADEGFLINRKVIIQ